jgi:hypothetical protein
MRGPDVSLLLSRAGSITGAVAHMREYYGAMKPYRTLGISSDSEMRKTLRKT